MGHGMQQVKSSVTLGAPSFGSRQMRAASRASMLCDGWLLEAHVSEASTRMSAYCRVFKLNPVGRLGREAGGGRGLKIVRAPAGRTSGPGSGQAEKTKLYRLVVGAWESNGETTAARNESESPALGIQFAGKRDGELGCRLVRVNSCLIYSSAGKSGVKYPNSVGLWLYRLAATG